MEAADGPALLLLDLPQAALAGIDLLSFTTTPRFRGVKHLPLEFHFAYVGASTAFSERHGVWFQISRCDPPALVINKWDAQTESLTVEEDAAEILRWRANLGSIWQKGLTPYRQGSNREGEEGATGESGDWPTLTSAITPILLTRITGRGVDSWQLSSASSSAQDLEDIPGLNAEDLNLTPEQQLHFLPISLKQTWRPGATGRERTEAAQDRTWALNDLVAQHCNGDHTQIIGELQFCFLMCLTINNFSCLEQWKRLLNLLFTCKRAVIQTQDLFISTIAALRLQLQHCKDAEGGLIDLADESGSLLKKLLVRFRKGLESLSREDVQDLVDELDDLEEYLQQEHGWQFGGSFAKSGVLELEDGEQVRMDTTAFDEDDETGEFAPQIVDLTPEQARLLNIEDGESTLHVNLSRTALIEVQSEEDSDSDESEVAGAGDQSDSEAGDIEDMDARY